MADEENPEGKIEEPKPEVQTQEGEPEVVSKEEAVTPEEPCDPMTMDCNELGDHIMDLVDKRIEYSEAIKKLETIKEVLPSETIDKLYDETVEKGDKVDDEIYLVVERAIACRTLKPEEKKKEPLKEEESIGKEDVGDLEKEIPIEEEKQSE